MTDPSRNPAMDGPAQQGASAHEEREISEVVDRLSVRFPEQQPARIHAVVAAAHEKFDGHPIRDFVPVLVERTARQTLTDSPPTG